jgi:hypothetical protein
MLRPLRAGVIGVGLAGGPHVEAIGRTGLAEVAADGLLLMRLIEAVTHSNAERAWVDVPAP